MRNLPSSVLKSLERVLTLTKLLLNRPTEDEDATIYPFDATVNWPPKMLVLASMIHAPPLVTITSVENVPTLLMKLTVPALVTKDENVATLAFEKVILPVEVTLSRPRNSLLL